MPAELWPAAWERSLRLGYTCFEEYAVRVIEADLVAGGPHVHGAAATAKLRALIEVPVTTAEACELMDVSHTYMTALKRAAGVRGGKVVVSRLMAYLKKHPEFTSKPSRDLPAENPRRRERRRSLPA